MVSDGYAFLVEMLYEAHAQRLPHRRGADHLRRAARRASRRCRRGVLARIADHAVAAACCGGRAAIAADMRHVVVMVTTSYPAVSGRQRRHLHGADRAAASPRAATRSTSSRPGIRCVTRPRVEERRPLPLLPATRRMPSLNVFGYAAALRADVALRGAAWRRRAAGARRRHGSRRCAVAPKRRATVMHGHWVDPGRRHRGGSRRPARPLVVSLHGSDVFVAETLRAGAASPRGGSSRAPAAVTACSDDLARRAIALGADPARSSRSCPTASTPTRFAPDAAARATRARARSASPTARRWCSRPAGWCARRGSST